MSSHPSKNGQDSRGLGGKSADGTHVALTSGGLDSTIAAHVSIRWGPAELLVYLDTTTDAAANRRYVERVADHLGVQVWTLRTHKPYGEWVRDRDEFPGYGVHNIAYRRLKEPQIDKLYALCETPLHLWTGIRAGESDSRLQQAAPIESGSRRAHRYWRNPIFRWSTRRCWEYLDRFGLPVNYLWFTLGRSADCFCGCYGAPEELIDAEAAGCERLVEQLRALEDDVEPDVDVAERGRWGWPGMAHIEQRAERGKVRDMGLCAACEPAPEPNTEEP